MVTLLLTDGTVRRCSQEPRVCACGCEEMFFPKQDHQKYVDPDHKNHARPRKTERRVRAKAAGAK